MTPLLGALLIALAGCSGDADKAGEDTAPPTEDSATDTATNTAPDDTASDDTAPDDTASDDTAPDDTTPTDTAPPTDTGPVVSITDRDVLLLLDVSGSMVQEFSDDPPRIAMMRDAVRAFTAALADDAVADRLGVVTFVAGAELWYPLADIEQPEGLAAADAQLATLDWCDRSYIPWDTAYDGAYYHDAPQMMACSTVAEGSKPTNPSDAGTSHADGLLLALSAATAEPADGRAPVVLLITDDAGSCVPEDDACDDALRADAAAAAAACREAGAMLLVVNLNDAPPVPDHADDLCALTSPEYTGADCVTANPLFIDYTPGGDLSADLVALAGLLP